MPLEQLADSHWDVIGLSVVRGTGEGCTVSKWEHVVCHRDLTGKREPGVGFLIDKEIAGSIE